MSSVLRRIRRVIRKRPSVPYGAPELLDAPPPRYESVDPNPICTVADFSRFASLASILTCAVLHKARSSRQAIMFSTIDVFEVTMEDAFIGLGSTGVAFDSAKRALLMIAMTTSLATLRCCALIVGLSNPCVSIHEKLVDLDTWFDGKDTAILAGIDAGRATLSNLGHLDVGHIIPPSEMDVVLGRVAWKAATTAVQGISLETGTQSNTITGIADALDISIRAGIDSGVPFNNSMAVLRVALAATLAATRSGIALLSQVSDPSSFRFNTPWMEESIAEAEKKAIEAGVRAGKAALPPFLSGCNSSPSARDIIGPS
ncbi:hypothetical protein F5Y10DRAFT_267468 [Nemania abortiva]|nr:hypothetical protein F5Y10DRAFT_267468 [Nemania abortiva]